MATYYVAEGGTAANKAAATSGTYPGGCMSPSVHNGETFSAGDEIVVSSLGGVYRGSGLNAPSSGTSGNHITYTFESSVVFSVPLATGWSVYSGNIYQCSVATEVVDLHYDETQGAEQASAGACTSEGDWYWSGGTLYLCAPGDPDTQYTTPGVEVTQDQGSCWYQNQKSYLTANGNGCEMRYRNGSSIDIWKDSGAVATDVIVDDFKIHDIRLGSGQQVDGISVQGTSNVTIRKCEIYNVSWDGIDALNPRGGVTETAYNLIIEQCKIYDIEHGGISVQAFSGRGTLNNVTLRYNWVENCTGDNIWIANQSTSGEGIHDVHVHHNISILSDKWGIIIAVAGGTEYLENVVVYNNTCAYNGQANTGGAIFCETVGADIKNNICYQNEQNGSYSAELWIDDNGGTANVMDYNCVYNTSQTNVYNWDGSLYTAANIYSSAGQQQNAVHADPKFADPDNGDFTLQSDSPCIGAGANLGADYDDALMPSSTWPGGVVTGDQDDYGAGWEIGAYIYEAAAVGFSATVAAVVTTGTPALSTTHSFSATVAAVASTGTPALSVEHSFSATVAAAISTGSPALMLGAQLTGIDVSYSSSTPEREMTSTTVARTMTSTTVVRTINEK